MKNGGVGANTERQAQNGDGEEAALQPEKTGGVAKILNKRFQKADGIHAVGGLLGESHITEFAPRREGGIPRIHSTRDVVVDLMLQVSFDLESEIFVALPASKVLEPFHDSLRGRTQHPGDSADYLIPAAAFT